MIDLSQLTDEQKATLLAQAREAIAKEGTAGNPPAPAPKDPVADLSAALTAISGATDLAGARDALLTTFKTALEGEYKRMQQNAGSMLAEMMAAIKEESDIANLSQSLTAGTDEAPRGLPVEPSELESLLKSLPKEQRAKVSDLLVKIQKSGLTDFRELGHGKKMTGTVELPADVAAKLDSKDLELSDLENPILGLGDLAQYNLLKWQK